MLESPRFRIQFDGSPPSLERLTGGARVTLMLPRFGRRVRTVYAVVVRKSNVVRLHPVSSSTAPDLIVNLPLALSGGQSARVAPPRETVGYLRVAA